MASSSYCFVFVSVALLLQLILGSASALTSTKLIDDICQHVNNKTFCVETLSAYPPAVSATGKFQLAKAVLRLGKSYALKSASFIEKASKDRPNMKKQFKACQDAYVNVVMSLKIAASELKESPESANYDVMVCTDSTTIVKDLVGKNRDVAAKKVMTMTLKMENLLAIAVGATVAVGG
ncbi:hypothetical protein CARUB_v10028167mg [Capsella rubella]|uniref:Pectinesterase inhibitor domain-containing protein n=1 Tax=Capsella rubella TaxID=81985 RepID=R0EZU7_9BRAS|nr:uncharacterized protein LOC17876056 [Capsella rubella]EOA14852.1 hypothetical protein CARUB_v10028167mg [Capsella rubella]